MYFTHSRSLHVALTKSLIHTSLLERTRTVIEVWQSHHAPNLIILLDTLLLFYLSLCFCVVHRTHTFRSLSSSSLENNNFLWLQTPFGLKLNSLHSTKFINFHNSTSLVLTIIWRATKGWGNHHRRRDLEPFTPWDFTRADAQLWTIYPPHHLINKPLFASRNLSNIWSIRIQSMLPESNPFRTTIWHTWAFPRGLICNMWDNDAWLHHLLHTLHVNRALVMVTPWVEYASESEVITYSAFRWFIIWCPSHDTLQVLAKFGFQGREAEPIPLLRFWHEPTLRRGGTRLVWIGINWRKVGSGILPS